MNGDGDGDRGGMVLGYFIPTTMRMDEWWGYG